jgi:hypothetical protein
MFILTCHHPVNFPYGRKLEHPETEPTTFGGSLLRRVRKALVGYRLRLVLRYISLHFTWRSEMYLNSNRINHSQLKAKASAEERVLVARLTNSFHMSPHFIARLKSTILEVKCACSASPKSGQHTRLLPNLKTKGFDTPFMYI